MMMKLIGKLIQVIFFLLLLSLSSLSLTLLFSAVMFRRMPTVARNEDFEQYLKTRPAHRVDYLVSLPLSLSLP